MSADDSTKRIPKSIGTETKLIGNYTLTDIAVGLLPGVLVLLAVQMGIPPNARAFGYSVQTLALPLVMLAMGFGGLFVYLTPEYTTSTVWLGSCLSFHRSSSDHDHAAAAEHTLLERVHPRRGALERTDGAFVGMVQVEPATMALATSEEWRSAAESFEGFLNTTVEFPLQIYSTTQEFPVEEYVSHYENRLSDPDVRANPKLEALVENYVEWYRSDLHERPMTIRDHYLIVAVAPSEVHFERESIGGKLTQLPVLGPLLDAVVAPPITHEHEAMFEALDDRLRRVENGVREIDGCAARRVEVDEMVELVSSFWSTGPVEYGDARQAVRTRPIAGGQA